MADKNIIPDQTWDEKAAVLGEFVTVCWGVLSGWAMHIAGPVLFVVFAVITAQTAPGQGIEKVMFIVVQIALDVAGTGLVIVGNQRKDAMLTKFGWSLVSLTIFTVCLVTIEALIAPYPGLVNSTKTATNLITNLLTLVRAVVSILYVVIMHAEHERKKHERREQINAQAQAKAARREQEEREAKAEEKERQRRQEEEERQARAEEKERQRRQEEAEEAARQFAQQQQQQDEDEDEPHTDKLRKPAPTRKPRTAQPAAPRKKRAVTGVQSKPRTQKTPEKMRELAHILNTAKAEGKQVSLRGLGAHFEVSPNTIKEWIADLQQVPA